MATLPVINLPTNLPTVPDINLPEIAEPPNARPPIPSFSFNDDDDNVSTITETTKTTMKITPDYERNILPAPVPGGSPRIRRRSLVEIESITESFAVVPPKSPAIEAAGGLFVPDEPVSHRRRISVVQWRDINTSLFNKDVTFEDADPQVTPFLSSAMGLNSIEDTFWSGKRDLIPSYDKMERLDQYAINGPSIPCTDVNELVNGLTKDANDDLEKFRIIFRWISLNISYDTHYLETGDRAGQTLIEVLQTGTAVCEGFCQLLCDMCTAAGVECEIITGFSKAFGFYPGAKDYIRKEGKHAWNRVRLGGQWYLCDATWAAGASNRDDDGTYTFTRRWGEGYFLANPDQMGATHFPSEMSEDDIDPALDAWCDTVQVGRAAFLYNLKCLSHESGIIHAKDNEVLIKIQSMHILDAYGRLTEAGNENVKFDNYSIHWLEDDVINFQIVLPKKGEFTFTAYGTPTKDILRSSTKQRFDEHVSDFYGIRLMTFTIIAEDSQETDPLPLQSNDVWGVEPSCMRSGFLPISHAKPLVTTADGKVCISFKQRSDPLPLIVYLTHADNPEENLEEHVYLEAVAERVACHMSFPRPGRYIFLLKMKFSDEKYHNAAGYVITSTREYTGGEDQSITFPKGPKGVWGPNDAFFKMGLTVRGPDSSTILAKDGEYYFLVRCDKSRDLEMNLTLKHAGSADELRSGHAFTQIAKGKHTTTASINLRLSEAGMYHLKVFARIQMDAERTYVGSWLVVCENPSRKSLFPKGSVNCGPTEEFYNHGLMTDEEALVETNNGECQIEVTLTQDILLSFSLKLGENEKDIHQGNMFSEIIKRDGERVANFKFRFHEVGLYAFRLFVKKTPKQDKATFVGMWLIDCQEVSPEQPYPTRSGLWGPAKVFHDAGMSVVGLETSRIILRKGVGRLSIKHSQARSAKKMSFRLDKDGNKYDATRVICAERFLPKGESSITTNLHLRLREPGLYALLVFDGSRQSNAFAGHWLVECIEPTQLPPFPEQSGLWGPSEHFFKMGMDAEKADSSTITTDTGEFQVEFTASVNFQATFHLFEDKKSNRLPKDHVTLNYGNNGRHMVECRVRLPHKGAFALQFYAAEKGQKKLNNCGIWLVIWKDA